MRVRIPLAYNPPLVTVLGAFALVRLASAATPTEDAWVTLSSPEHLAEIVGEQVGFSEGFRQQDGVLQARITASPQTLQSLRDAGWVIIPTRFGGPNLDGYRLPDTGLPLLADLADSSRRAGLQQWGSSHQDRPIHALWLGQPPESGSPSFRILAAHHGDEASSYEVALDIAETLLAEDGVNTAITETLDDFTVWVVPYVNPDGAAAGTRQNALGVDLNRNYGVQWSANAFQAGATAFSEPETRAIRDSALLTLPHTSLSLHAGATNIGYVWNYTTDDTPEHTLLHDLGTNYADNVDNPSFYVTNGADWYPTRGDTNDWSYGRYGGLDYTVELTQTKAPPATTIDDYLQEHRAAILQAVTHRPALIGQVLSRGEGLPIAARLELLNGGQAISQPFFANPLSGDFARPMLPEDALIRVSAPGYTTRTQDVRAGQRAIIRLEPTSLLTGRTTPASALAGDTVTLPNPAPPVVTWTRPGVERVIAVQNGVITLPSDLPPGPYTIVAPSGDAWPNAGFVSGGGSATLTAIQAEGRSLTVLGSDLGPGTLAIALVGPERSPVPLTRTQESPTSVTFTLPVVQGMFDIWVQSSGTHALFPLTNTRGEDTGLDTDADTRPPFELNRTGCGCSQAPIYPMGLIVLFPLLWRRRL